MTEHKNPEIRFKRELRQNYLMIAAGEELEQKFEARMLAGNTIDGLLKFCIRREDDRLWFCYEITSRQPLSRLLERTGITAPQIRRLLLGIAQTLTRMEDYLLNEALICLDPDLIYMDFAEFQPGLCLVPGRKGDFPREFSGFLQFLLGKTDHRDKEAVMLVYGLYQESLKDNYGLNDLLRWLMKEDYSDMERAYTGGDTEVPEEGRNGIAIGDSPETEERSNTAALKAEIRKAELRAGPGRLMGWLFLPALAAASLWMWRGTPGIVRYGPAVIGGAAVLAVIGAGAGILYRPVRSSAGNENCVSAGGRGTDRCEAIEEPGTNKDIKSRSRGDPPMPQAWEMVFEESEPDPPFRTDSFADREYGEAHLPEPSPPMPEDATHTVLLRPAVSGTVIRRLSGIGGTAETIPISYYPFLIGKQESLADYILKEDTVSRLHARLDRRDETYWLTDLNSTNGTAVNGRALEANEVIQLHIGDTVDLADLHFKFE